MILAGVLALSVLGGCKGGGGGGDSFSAPPPDPGPESGAITIEWDPVTMDVMGNPESVYEYRVYVSQTEEDFGQPSYIVNSPTVEIDDLAPGVIYYVSVRAFDGSGNESALSDSIAIQI